MVSRQQHKLVPGFLVTILDIQSQYDLDLDLNTISDLDFDLDRTPV